MTVNVSDNRYGVARYIVAPTLAEGANFTTITAALAAASSGQTIFVRPGTYTENLTLKAGVDIVSFDADAQTPNTTIVGKLTASFAGTCSISGIRLQTNSDNFLLISGSSATVVKLNNCYLNCSNNTGISFTSSSSSSNLLLNYCLGDIGTTGITLAVCTTSGVFEARWCKITNSGLTTTATSFSAGTFQAIFCTFEFPFSTSSTAAIGVNYCNLKCDAINATALTVNGSSASNQTFSKFSSGTASAISVGASGVVNLSDSEVNSTNTNAITGAGSITYGPLAFTNSSSTINTTTQGANWTTTGRWRAPFQPAFLAYLGSNDLNVTGNGAGYTLGTNTALTEVFDQGTNFNTNGTFTAPITGRYFLESSIVIVGTTVATTFTISLVTSNRNINSTFARAASANNERLNICAVTDMDASDTCTVLITISGEAGNTDDLASSNTVTKFSGCLLA